jgi:hypothetical protein
LLRSANIARQHDDIGIGVGRPKNALPQVKVGEDVELHGAPPVTPYMRYPLKLQTQGF